MALNQSISSADKGGILKVRPTSNLVAGDLVSVTTGGEYVKAGLKIHPYYGNVAGLPSGSVATCYSYVGGMRPNISNTLMQRCVAELGNGSFAFLQSNTTTSYLYVAVNDPYNTTSCPSIAVDTSGATSSGGNIHALSSTTFGVVFCTASSVLTLKIFNNGNASTNPTLQTTVTIQSGANATAQYFDSTVLTNGNLAIVASYGTTTTLYTYTPAGTLINSVTVVSSLSAFVALKELSTGGVAVQYQRNSDSFGFLAAYDASLNVVFAPVNYYGGASTYPYATRGQTLIEMDNGHLVVAYLLSGNQCYFSIYTASGVAVKNTSTYCATTYGLGGICPSQYGFTGVAIVNGSNFTYMHGFNFDGSQRYAYTDVGVASAGGANSAIINSFSQIVRFNRTSYIALSNHYYSTTPAFSQQSRLLTESASNHNAAPTTAALHSITAATSSANPQGSFVYVAPSKTVVHYWGTPGASPASVANPAFFAGGTLYAGVALDTVLAGQECRVATLGTYTLNAPVIAPVSFNTLSNVPKGGKGYVNNNSITLTTA